jgi:hypothetical protein
MWLTFYNIGTGRMQISSRAPMAEPRPVRRSDAFSDYLNDR